MYFIEQLLSEARAYLLVNYNIPTSIPNVEVYVLNEVKNQKSIDFILYSVFFLSVLPYFCAVQLIQKVRSVLLQTRNLTIWYLFYRKIVFKVFNKKYIKHEGEILKMLVITVKWHM